ncbi:structural maintenance of chromosomes flexible hinge domain-containing protein 1-like [Saccostrea cucullata]|uniref:structural maintenance of chromosomes flexible hinge domain-containing protein 1-like n=1 Tax=Saccostrea cuccullata TaxID=36930 RepID=UPI002ED03BCE
MATNRRGKEAETPMEDDDAFVYVFDRRDKDAPDVKIPTGGLFTFEDFKERVREALQIKKKDNFVIATTNREEIKDDETWDDIDNGDTLYVLKKINQELCAPANERVNFVPHYDTIVKGGLYEYYASEGQNPLPYAFAELIDNALSATAENTGPRNIDILLHFDDGKPSNNAIFIIDNGKGMTPRQLNNWAIYRLSKFKRKDKRGKVSFIEGEDDDEEVEQKQAPLCLNSDISYFGVGGKQAVFFIGNSTRMMTKAMDSQDIHELTMSKEEFKQKEINKESVYSGFIRNRKVGDSSHIPSENEILQNIIKEEKKKQSFTVVEIGGINPSHVLYLRHHIADWTRQLAHIYHYYIHGPEGNRDLEDDMDRPNTPFNIINIRVKLNVKGKPATEINLRDIHDDMQSLYVRNSASQFFFKATTEGEGVVEGIIRYHPFLYDSETYPSDVNDPRERSRLLSAKHDQQGGLAFDWCSEPKKSRTIAAECWNRISGVLFTNDHFQVSTNKLTFLDLEMRLRDKSSIFSRVVNGQEKRTSIEREFLNWLKDCHEQYDKQIHFTGYAGQVVRTDLPKQRQTPWSRYKSVVWDNKTFKVGQMVKILRTTPVLLGTIKNFYLYGEHEEDTFATGGEIEIQQEPQSLYNEVRVVPLSRLDRLCGPASVKRYLEEEESKLPESLIVTWPEGDIVKPNEKRPAGKTIGAIKIEIENRKGEKIQKLPGTTAHASQKKLLVELKVVWHSPNGDQTIVSHISQHGKTWPYWFRKMENIHNLGPHTLQLQVVLNESGSTIYAGKSLPSHHIKFTVTEGEPEKFTMGMLEGPFRIGQPFQIPLVFRDAFNNITKPLQSSTPTIQARDLDISYEKTVVKGSSLILSGIVAKGVISEKHTGSYGVTITVPGLREDAQALKIRMLPGPPKVLNVKPEEKITIENGTAPVFRVEVLDLSGNITTDKNLTVTCKFTGTPTSPTYSLDCSAAGCGNITGEPILLKKVKDKQELTAKFEVTNKKDIPAVERSVLVTPSNSISHIEIKQEENKKKRMLKQGESIMGIAGESITGLTFVLYDEAGRTVTVDDKILPKIKINWTPKLNQEMIMSGNLPPIKVPSSVTDLKYCQVAIHDKSNVEFSFTVNALPAEPNQIKCKCQGPAAVQIGEMLKHEIQITVKDKFGNEITDLPKNSAHEFQVTGDGLQEQLVKVTSNKNGFAINNVQFEGGKIGTKDLKVTWRDLRDFVRIEMVAGPPEALSLPGWDCEETLTVLNESKLPRSIVVQLCDQFGNPSKLADVRVQLTKEGKIKLYPPPTPLKTNAQGQVDFGVLTVSGPRGNYELQPKAFHGKADPILGPKISIQLQPNLMKPTSLSVEYDKKANFVVGEKLPEFTVKVLTEDDQPMASAKVSSLSLKLWKMDANVASGPPSRAVSHSPEAVKGSPGVFLFKERKTPESAAVHQIMITYYDGQYELFSNVMTVHIKPAPPMQLLPVDNPGTPTVSNTKATTARCVVRHLRLELRDQHGNASGTGYNGKVKIEICGPEDVTEIPCFVGGSRTLEIPLNNGACALNNLTIQENAPGQDGQEYLLRCNVVCSLIPRNKSIPPLEIPFLFYNDVKKQSQMSQLSKQRDNLQKVINTYRSLFDTTELLTKELQTSVREAIQEENKIREELQKLKVNLSQSLTMPNIEKQIESKKLEKEKYLRTNRRTCGLQQLPGNPDIVGKIGHLAEIEDPDIARVLSWHMSSDIDCVVTKTTKMAKEVYKQTNGKQQVLPIDSIFKKSLPDWNKPLPHIRYRSGWKPPGNPAYARGFLQFPGHKEECQIVFGMLLGDTLILDDLNSANSYRQEIVKFTHCPTILTREGDRIRSNGKFGGLMNKAVPFEKLKGAVFGEPLPRQYKEAEAVLETLQRLKVAMQKTEKAKEELKEQSSYIELPEMKIKKKECQEAEKQLKEIEQKLGMTSTPPRSRTPQVTPPVSEAATPSKRSRLTNRTPVNGTETAPSPSPQFTPTRQSKRLASITPTSEDSRKKLRRT